MARMKDVMGTGNSGPAARAIVGTFGTIVGTGTSQATATALPYALNTITTASSQEGGLLPTTAQGSEIGDSITVYVSASTTGKVYPGGTETINGSTSAISVAQAKMAIFTRTSATNWGNIITA